MSENHPLEGSCSCGRFNYIVVIPEAAREQAQVHFRTDHEHRRSQGALLTAFLKVPLSWYTSRTVSFFPDETHSSISRTFHPSNEPYSQRKFCGYCGTHLSYWTEEPRDEREYLNITLGSLRSNDLETLKDLELLPEDAAPSDSIEPTTAETGDSTQSAVAANAPGSITRTVRQGQDGSMTWFEEMLDGSHLGRARTTRRGVGTSADGSTSVTWEFTEVGGDEDVIMTSASSSSKRKIGDVAEETET